MIIKINNKYEVQIEKENVTIWEYGTVPSYENVRRWVIDIDLSEGGTIKIGSEELSKGDSRKHIGSNFSYFKNTLKGERNDL